jgi:hypothetical protein
MCLDFGGKREVVGIPKGAKQKLSRNQMVMVWAFTNMTQVMNMAFMQWVANNNNIVSISM